MPFYLESGNPSDPPVFVTLSFEKDTVIQFRKQKYQFKAGVERVAPSELYLLNFGDPRSGPKMLHYKDPKTEQNHYIPDRNSELRRLYIKWGVESMGGIEHIPVPMARAEDGTPLPFILHDQECECIVPFTDEITDITTARINRTDTRIEKLLARLKTEGIDIDDDEPFDNGMIPVDGD